MTAFAKSLEDTIDNFAFESQAVLDWLNEPTLRRGDTLLITDPDGRFDGLEVFCEGYTPKSRNGPAMVSFAIADGEPSKEIRQNELELRNAQRRADHKKTVETLERMRRHGAEGIRKGARTLTKKETQTEAAAALMRMIPAKKEAAFKGMGPVKVAAKLKRMGPELLPADSAVRCEIEADKCQVKSLPRAGSYLARICFACDTIEKLAASGKIEVEADNGIDAEPAIIPANHWRRRAINLEKNILEPRPQKEPVWGQEKVTAGWFGKGPTYSNLRFKETEIKRECPPVGKGKKQKTEGRKEKIDEFLCLRATARKHSPEGTINFSQMSRLLRTGPNAPFKGVSDSTARHVLSGTLESLSGLFARSPYDKPTETEKQEVRHRKITAKNVGKLY